MPEVLDMVDFLFSKVFAIDTTNASLKLTYSKESVTAECSFNGIQMFMDVKKYLKEAGLEQVRDTKYEGMAIALLYADTLDNV